MLHSRIKRVDSLLKEEITDIIVHDIKDPRIESVTIQAVKTSKDLHNAIVFISTLEIEKLTQILEILNKAQGYIRRKLGERISLKYLPKLDFKKDDGMLSAMRIDEILKEIHNESVTTTDES